MLMHKMNVTKQPKAFSSLLIDFIMLQIHEILYSRLSSHMKTLNSTAQSSVMKTKVIRLITLNMEIFKTNISCGCFGQGKLFMKIRPSRTSTRVKYSMCLHHTVQLYCILGIMNSKAFPAQNITLTPASIFLQNSLGVLFRLSQAQKCLQRDPKPSQQVFMKFYLTKLYAD